MKMLVKPIKYDKSYSNCDGIILPLKDYSISYDTYFTFEEIKEIRKEYNKEIFVVVNRMFFNEDIDNLKNILLELDKLNITGIFYYDLAVLKLKKELNLNTDLVWNATFMVTNYRTCDYYYNKGVKYACISNEITIDEALEIKNKSKIIPMFTLISIPTVANSYRNLLTNYSKMHNRDIKNELVIKEKITKDDYIVKEDKYGTTFKYGKVINNCEAYSKLKENDFPYLILIEDGIEHNTFIEVLKLVKEENFGRINELIGNNTLFLNKKTIYKVKKNG